VSLFGIGIAYKAAHLANTLIAYISYRAHCIDLSVNTLTEPMLLSPFFYGVKATLKSKIGPKPVLEVESLKLYLFRSTSVLDSSARLCSWVPVRKEAVMKVIVESAVRLASGVSFGVNTWLIGVESEGAKILLYFQGLGARKAIITVKVKGHKRRLNSQSQTYGKRLEGTKSFLT